MRELGIIQGQGIYCTRYSGFEDVVVPHLNEIVEYLDDILFFARERAPPQETEDCRHCDIAVNQTTASNSFVLLI